MSLVSPALEAWFNQHEPGAAHSLGGTMIAPWSGPELATMLPPGWGAADLAFGYAPTPGSASTRSLIAASLGVGPEQVLLTTGATEANHTALRGLLTPGCRVILQAPLYYQFAGLAAAAGAEVVPWTLAPDPAVPPSLAALDALLDARTRLVVLNTPHNPTGRVLEPELLRQVAARVHALPDAYLLVDEIYRELTPEPGPSARSLGPRVLVTDSVSKAWSLPGLRLGWLAGEPELLARLRPVHEYATTCVSRVSEALLEALWPRRGEIFAHHRRLAARNRTIMTGWLSAMAAHLGGQVPAAGVMGLFWPRGDRDDVALATHLRTHAGVFTLPGSTLGYPGALRLGYGHRDAGDLVAALAALARGLGA